MFIQEMIAYKKTDLQENLIDPQTKKQTKGSGSNGQSGNKSSKATTTAKQPYDYKKHPELVSAVKACMHCQCCVHDVSIPITAQTMT